MKDDQIKAEVEAYYTEKVKKHGTSHWGVDWNSTESQECRFTQLAKVLPHNEVFSLIDYGCGYGALYPWLKRASFRCKHYLGFDLSPEMIAEAEKKYGKKKDLEWVTKLKGQQTDYIISSGIFNVKMKHEEEDWKQYIINTLRDFRSRALKGFSFNILTSYSDEEFQRDYLYYADPLFFFDFCKRNFSQNVALLHDYDLYEFTILVKLQK